MKGGTAMASTQNKLTHFGKIVVKALTEQDKTKTELAAEIGTSPQYLSYILHGTRSGEKYRQPIIAAFNLDGKQLPQ
jgi:transcriptional regulator with XRE-family HTH domain